MYYVIISLCLPFGMMQVTVHDAVVNIASCVLPGVMRYATWGDEHCIYKVYYMRIIIVLNSYYSLYLEC